ASRCSTSSPTHDVPRLIEHQACFIFVGSLRSRTRPEFFISSALMAALLQSGERFTNLKPLPCSVGAFPGGRAFMNGFGSACARVTVACGLLIGAIGAAHAAGALVVRGHGRICRIRV